MNELPGKIIFPDELVRVEEPPSAEQLATDIAESFINTQIRNTACAMLDPTHPDHNHFLWISSQIDIRNIPKVVARAEGIPSKQRRGKRYQPTSIIGGTRTSKLHERLLMALESSVIAST